MVWCIMTYIIAYVKTQKNKIGNEIGKYTFLILSQPAVNIAVNKTNI